MTEPRKGGKPRQTYTDADVTRALTALTMYRGNSRQAARVLEAQGAPVPESTIRAWAKQHADVYNRIRKERGKELEEEAAVEVRDSMRLAEEVTRAALELELRRLAGRGDKVRDASASAKNAAQAAEKMHAILLSLTNRPNVIISERADDVLEQLRRLNPDFVVEGTATEVKPDELPPSNDKQAEGPADA